MNTPKEPGSQMPEKTDQQLEYMYARPSDWSPEALHAARAELIINAEYVLWLYPSESQPPILTM